MKFYKDNSNIVLFNKMKNNNLTYIYSNNTTVQFIKNGINHNYKNLAYIAFNTIKGFYLYGCYYGDQTKFTKSSWRKFTKLQVFL